MRVRSRGELIRTYVLENVGVHPKDIARAVCQKFGISRQAASRHIRNLVAEQAILPEGETRNRAYRLAPMSK
jgi:predicted transcriptional regulator